MAESRILIADRNDSVRAALAEMLHATGETRELEGVDSLSLAAERIEECPVDMVVVELSSISMDELEQVNLYRSQYPRVSWVVVSLFPDLRGVLERQLGYAEVMKGDPVTAARA